MVIDTEENAKRYYENMLKEGGEIHVPPQKRFYSDFNAVVIDRFGFVWTFEGGYKFYYFPKQKREKISSRTASEARVPVILPI